MKKISLLAVLLVAATVSACRKQPEVTPEPEPAPVTPVATVDSAAIRDSIARAREAERRAAEERARAEARRALEAVVYFDFDRADLSETARRTLDAKIAVLRSSPSVRLRIEGHTDSRGSDEYNMALGQRRAAAVRQYLVNQGISADRLEIVSYGEEMPAAEGENEAAWAQNRRAASPVIGGEIVVRVN